MLHTPMREVPKCAGCDAPAQWEVWGEPMCVECHAAWHAAPQFDAGAIERACGIDSRAPSKPGDAEKYAAEATRRTKAGLAARAKARAA